MKPCQVRPALAQGLVEEKRLAILKRLDPFFEAAVAGKSVCGPGGQHLGVPKPAFLVCTLGLGRDKALDSLQAPLVASCSFRPSTAVRLPAAQLQGRLQRDCRTQV